MSRGDTHGTSVNRASDRPRAAMSALTEPTPQPPTRPPAGLPAFVLALASAPAGAGPGGVDPPPAAAEGPPSVAPLLHGRTVAPVDLHAAGRPVQRGPPPPQQLLITQSPTRR
ncbi:hypothetical protein [Micromonospora tarensis]|uniref:Uncharacterized protein n=1 Tax=Micromonospora tarensis TaxID=2806100 RepID=A0ABS1YJT6_9ACTN|nr:hypothetical protein [Micromonospora tarensis]MBM0277683.1 hypothetical protein [Micromonospora tarensis]